MTTHERARKFIYQNARPLDFARWQYHFENGSKDAVLAALDAYQNEDGGFGYGLEADCFNPNSSPIQTWVATEILKEIDFEDREHPVIKGILAYLASGADFDEQRRQWLNTVPGNNEYPHAIWWEYREGAGEFKYNPTACLAGFFLKYGSRDSAFYDRARQIAREAFEYFSAAQPYLEGHVTACFIRLYEYCREANAQLFDMEAFQAKLREQVKAEIASGIGKWETEYVFMPSNLIRSKSSMFYPDHREIVAQECAFIKEHQLPDGSFAIPWKWWTDYKEYEIAANWWKADFCIRNMLFLRTFS